MASVNKILYFAVVLLTGLAITDLGSCTRTVRQTTDSSDDASNAITTDSDGEGESFINMAELKNLDLSQLLEINFVNKSVSHYKDKLHQVQSSLQNRVKDLVAGIRSDKSKFSPELQLKLNESFYKLVESLRLSPYCLASLNHLRLEIAEKQLWPIQFIDAMELVPSGMFEGLLSSFGLYEECLAIESPAVKWNDIRGKYCLAKVHLPFMNPTFPEASDLEDKSPNEFVDVTKLSAYAKRKALFERLGVEFDTVNNKLKLLQMINMLNGSHYRIGLCIPSTCSSAELEYAINKFLEPINNPIHIDIEDECSVANQATVLNMYQVLALLVLGALAALVVASTCYEYYLMNYRNNDTAKNIYDSYLVTFSAISNTRSLFDDEGDRRLRVVDTVVFAFVVIEFVGRSYVLPVFYGMINIKRPLNGLPKEFFTAKKFFFIRGSSFAACTYVLASAIILAYNICAYKQTSKPSAISYLKFVANRWLSYSRRLIGPILLVYLVPLLGDGPIWHYYEQIYTNPCKYNLLPTFLFYSNYADSLDETCVAPSVILSTLFYLSLVAPFILYTLNYKLIGYIVFVSLIVLGSIGSIIPKMVFNLPVTPYEVSSVVSVAQAKLSFMHYFAATDQLLVVFVCGLFIGYILKCKPKINLGSQISNCALWAGMLFLPFLSTSWNEGFKPLEGNFSQFSFVAWFVLSKIMWSFGFGWIMFACTTGRAGPIGDIFQLPLLRPLTKLAFTVYLNHISILSYRQLSKKDIGPLNHVEILTDDISDLVIAFGVSYAFYILIERPFYFWIKILLKFPNAQSVKRFSANDLENGKLNSKEEIDLKPLNNRD